MVHLGVAKNSSDADELAAAAQGMHRSAKPPQMVKER